MKMSQHNNPVYQTLQNQRGFALMDFMIWGTIALIAVIGILALSNTARNTMHTNSITSDITHIVNQSRSWKGIKPKYTGISMSSLTGMGLLNTAWGAGTGINPVGGNYTVAANTSDDTKIDITVTGMTNEQCLDVENRVESTTVGGNSASCSSGTLTGSFR